MPVSNSRAESAAGTRGRDVSVGWTLGEDSCGGCGPGPYEMQRVVQAKIRRRYFGKRDQRYTCHVEQSVGLEE